MGIPSRDRGGKKVVSERCHAAAEGERHLSLGHSLVVIHRLIEMGSFEIQELARNMPKSLAEQCCN